MPDHYFGMAVMESEYVKPGTVLILNDRGMVMVPLGGNFQIKLAELRRQVRMMVLESFQARFPDLDLEGLYE